MKISILITYCLLKYCNHLHQSRHRRHCQQGRLVPLVLLTLFPDSKYVIKPKAQYYDTKCYVLLNLMFILPSVCPLSYIAVFIQSCWEHFFF